MDNIVFDEWKPNLATWWQRFLLRFKPMHYWENTHLMLLGYKWLFGQVFIIREIPHPPQHPNSRCHIEVPK